MLYVYLQYYIYQYKTLSNGTSLNSQVISERDILGTQLVRRNDELALLYEKIKIQQSVLNKGEVQYNQRLEDIRVLKLEIKKLRREKTILQKSVANVEDLRYMFIFMCFNMNNILVLFENYKQPVVM